MSLTTRVLVGLVAGLAIGIAISVSGAPGLLAIVPWIEPIGTLWVNAIRMTVIPLVVSLLIVGVASAGDTGVIGRLGGRALALFLVLLTVTATAATLAAYPLFQLFRVDETVSASLRTEAAASAARAEAGAGQVPHFVDWLTDLVPTNPIAAAAEGAILPLVVFALAFGLALIRVDEGSRDGVLRFFRGTADAMLVLVQWILALAPIGVFALALPLATRMGLAAAGALAYYVVVVVGLSLAVMALVLYPLAVLGGGVRLGRFARACLPAQAVAFSGRSSLAALPLLIEEAERTLRFPRPVVSFFLPLSASVFRVGAAIALPVGVIFIARLYGAPLDAVDLGAIAGISVLLSFSVPGIPGGSIFIMAPVLLAAGVPVEGLGILLGVDTIPDMFRTTANVTGHMAAGTVVARGAPD